MLKIILGIAAAVALAILLLAVAFIITCWQLAGYITKEFEHINGKRS